MVKEINYDLISDFKEIINYYLYDERLSKDYFHVMSTAIRKTYGIDYVLPVSTGTAALHTALKAKGLSTDGQVLIPVHTCASVAMAVIHANGIPILVDTDEFLGMNPVELEKKLHSNVKAVIITHQYGIPSRINDLKRIIRKVSDRILIIEDCSQAHSSKINQKYVGTTGDVSVFSFNKGKTINAGMGGVICTNNRWLYKEAKRFSNLGSFTEPYHEIIGYNFQMSEISALLIEYQLKKLEKAHAERQYNAELYMSILKKLGVREYCSKIKGERSSYYRLVIDVSLKKDKYNQLVEYLKYKGHRFQAKHPDPLYKAKFLMNFYKDKGLTILVDELDKGFYQFKDQEESMIFLYCERINYQEIVALGEDIKIFLERG